METKKNNKSLGGTVKKQHKTKQQAGKPTTKQAVKATTKQAKAVSTKRSTKSVSKPTTKPRRSQKGGGEPGEWIARTSQYCDDFRVFNSTITQCSQGSVEDQEKCVRNIVESKVWSKSNCANTLLGILAILKAQDDIILKAQNGTETAGENYNTLRNAILGELKEYTLLNQIQEGRAANQSAGGSIRKTKKSNDVSVKAKPKTNAKKGGAGDDEELNHCLFNIGIVNQFNKSKGKGFYASFSEATLKDVKNCAKNRYGNDHALIRLWNNKINKSKVNPTDIVGMYISNVQIRRDSEKGDEKYNPQHFEHEQSCHKHNIAILNKIKEIDSNKPVIPDQQENAAGPSKRARVEDTYDAYDDVKNKILQTFEKNYNVGEHMMTYAFNLVEEHMRKEEEQQVKAAHGNKMSTIYSRYNGFDKKNKVWIEECKKTWQENKLYDDMNRCKAETEQAQKAFLESFTKYLIEGKGTRFLNNISYSNYNLKLEVNNDIVNHYKRIYKKVNNIESEITVTLHPRFNIVQRSR